MHACTMRILIEAHHPAHIHFFKNAIRIWREHRHEVLLLGRERDVMRKLLEACDWIPYRLISRAGKSNRFPAREMVARQWAVASAIRSMRPDIVVSVMGSYTQPAFLFGVPNIVFTDSEFQHFNHRIAHPFATRIYTPACFTKPLGPKQVRYPGYHELAFLHPHYFKPDPAVLAHLDGAGARQYLLLRLSAWDTLHDIGQRGFAGYLAEAIAELSARTRVFIIPEAGLDLGELEPYRLRLPPHMFHDALAFSRLVITEGASTASEAACLGVPAIYVSSTSRGYLDDQAKRYQLVHDFRSPEAALERALTLLDEYPDSTWLLEQQARLVQDHIDVTDFVVREIEGFRRTDASPRT